MATKYAFTMNGRINEELKERGKSGGQVIREKLNLLDGRQRFSLSLWALPTDVPFDRVDLTTWPMEYIQCAGDSQRLTVEMRTIIAGKAVQWVIGKANVSPARERLESVAWAGNLTQVGSHEVFDAGEVTDVFTEYMRTGDLPPEFTRRESSPNVPEGGNATGPGPRNRRSGA